MKTLYDKSVTLLYSSEYWVRQTKRDVELRNK